MENQQPEKKSVSPTAMKHMARATEFRRQMTMMLFDNLVNNADNGERMHELLLADTNGRKQRVFPLRDIRQVPPASVYVRIDSTLLSTPESQVIFPWAVATSDPNAIERDNAFMMVISDFTPMFFIGGLVDNLERRLTKWDRKELMHFEQMKSVVGIEKLKTLWMIRPNRPLDVCDLVRVPDVRMLKKLGPTIERRILRHGIQ